MAEAAVAEKKWRRAKFQAMERKDDRAANLPLRATSHPGQHQRRPAFEPDAADEHEPAGTIACNRCIRLRRQQS
jgi:hypothetical protein